MKTEGNSYEEARKRRVEENLKRFEGLGIAAISKNLSEVTKTEAKRHTPSPHSKKRFEVSEPRRSSRSRNLIASYRDDDVGEIDHRSFRRSYSRSKGNRAYTGRVCSYEERVQAIKRAEKLQSSIKSGSPSFVKSMVRSHVSSCFWLGLPTRFCKDHLPPNELKMTLEDEEGVEYEAVYIGNRTGLSGGWRGFSLDHDLDDGDAILFELIRHDRFKVYIMRASEKSYSGAKGKDNEAIFSSSSSSPRESLTSEDDEGPVSKKAKPKAQPQTITRTRRSKK